MSRRTKERDKMIDDSKKKGKEGKGREICV
jgi:hypothetical protein